jgi:hypothetical protein
MHAHLTFTTNELKVIEDITREKKEKIYILVRC